MPKKLLLSIIFLFFTHTVSQAQNIFKNEDTSLESQWDLTDSVSGNSGLFQLNSYKPIYVLFANFSNSVNKQPYSETHSLESPIPLNTPELKFQLSLKSKVIQNILGKYGGDLWLGYTQTSRWQLYNEEISRPFRETNYEPELMFILPTKYKILGINGVYTGIGLNHQSNGRGGEFSRSWNRIILQLGWETKHTTIVVRPWWRIQESIDVDDNPGIENYMGRVEMIVAYQNGRHDLSLIGHHSLRFNENNRGSLQVDYAIRVWDNLKLHAQLFHGYGESMIDFNHKQTTIGFGVSIIEWR